MTRCFVLIDFILLVFANVFGIDDIPQDVIPLLYAEYKGAVDNAINDNTMSLRRIFKNNKEYKIHVKKLKEVNGFKRHNLILREEAPGKSLIYVNNPVETKIPKAYLTLEEFKQLLTDRVSLQREKFKKYNKVKPSILVPTRTTFKPHFINSREYKRTIKITRQNKQNTTFETNNRPPIQITQRPHKPKHNTVNIIDKNIFPNITEVTKDIIKNLTQININNFTTKLYKTGLESEITRREEEEGDTNKVDIETTAIQETELTVTPEFNATDSNQTQSTNTDYNDAAVNISAVSETFVTDTEETTSVTTTKPTRRTLSRPLVFMGGY